jgi:hypothetical protein
MELTTGTPRRRSWTIADKARIVAESFSGHRPPSELALKHGIHRNRIYNRRRERPEAATSEIKDDSPFVPVQLVSPEPGTSAAGPGQHIHETFSAVVSSLARPYGCEMARTATSSARFWPRWVGRGDRDPQQHADSDRPDRGAGSWRKPPANVYSPAPLPPRFFSTLLRWLGQQRLFGALVLPGVFDLLAIPTHYLGIILPTDGGVLIARG